MRDEYDFSNAKPAKEVAHLNKLRTGKTKVTIMLDNDIIQHFRQLAEKNGRGYQTLINEALRPTLDPDNAPVTANQLKNILQNLAVLH